jgi:phage/plasmid-like protein (TIGR03299 family)
MSHNLELRDGRYSFAFTGTRDQIWHRLGQQLEEGATQAEWAKAAGLDFEVAKVPAIVSLEGVKFDHIAPAQRFLPAPNRKFIVREDNGHVLGLASDAYKVVQPRDVLDWFSKYITVDERFHLDAAGVLHSGEAIWATARFNGDMKVAGESHKARLLMSTSFDQSRPTTNQGTTTRAVCNNTLSTAWADNRAVIKTTHRSHFNGEQVAKELATIAQSFDTFKKMGDAMAATALAKDEVSKFFKTLLEIPFDAKADDISGRKMNQFSALSQAYTTTKRERNTKADDVWSALQAVTRYVDHERSVRNVNQDDANDVTVGRFAAATFGTGNDLKGKAFNMLLPLIADKVKVAA